jgi:putative cardiolipin synthase
VALLASLGALIASALLAGCARVALNPDPTPSQALRDTQATHIGRVAQSKLAGAAPDESAVHGLSSGLSALAARLALIDHAQRCVDLQYYIWRDDTSGNGLAGALWRAADRGVRVRLLLDDWGSRPSDRILAQLSSHPNIEIRLFNPLEVRWWPTLGMVLDFNHANRRMHNKLLVADNQAAIVGGRNVGDEYFERRDDLEFGDFDVLLMGPVVRELSSGFDRYWNSPAAQSIVPTSGAPLSPLPEPAPDLWAEARESEFVKNIERKQLDVQLARVRAVQDPPTKVESTPEAAHSLGHDIVALTGEVQSDLLIVSPYFIPGPGGVAQIKALRDRGVRVRVITNSLAATDVPAVHAGYAHYRADLLRMGVELYEMRADVKRKKSRGIGSSRVSLHAKILIIDHRHVFVGSMNIDPRSIRINTENGVVINSPALAEQASQRLEKTMAHDSYKLRLIDNELSWTSDSQTYDTEPGASAWLRIKTELMSWFMIEKLL